MSGSKPLLPMLALSVILASFAASCEVGEPRQGREIALSKTEHGEIYVLYNPCVNTQVRGVRLVRVRGNVFGDDNDEVLWSIESSVPRDLDSLTIGVPVEGFEERAKLGQPPMEGKLGIQIFIGVGRRFDGRQFTLDQLRIGTFLDARDRYLSEEEFRALDTCDL